MGPVLALNVLIETSVYYFHLTATTHLASYVTLKSIEVKEKKAAWERTPRDLWNVNVLLAIVSLMASAEKAKVMNREKISSVDLRKTKNRQKQTCSLILYHKRKQYHYVAYSWRNTYGICFVPTPVCREHSLGTPNWEVVKCSLFHRRKIRAKNKQTKTTTGQELFCS